MEDPALSASLPDAAPSSVLTDHQIKTLSALTDRLIPPSSGTPGGAAGGALTYIVRELEGGGNLARFQAEYRDFLDFLAAQGFAGKDADAQDTLLTAIEQTGDAAARRFFALVAEQAQEGYYTNPANWPAIGYRVTG